MQPQLFLGETAVANETPNDLQCCQPQIPVLAELLCSERPLNEHHDDTHDENDPPSVLRSLDEPLRQLDDDFSVDSFFDPVLLHHSKIISRLKILEDQMMKPRDYFQTSSNSSDEVLPYMRKIVASWMLEVCEEQRCEEAVFPLAAALMDRFLATCSIKKEILQLIACVCLLLASKTRQCNHFSLELLSWYTDNSVSPQSLRSWELMMLSQLNWDVNIITANDFVDFLLVRASGHHCQLSKHTQIIRRHANTFIALCSTEPRFVSVKPSLIAAAAIYAAMKGMKRQEPKLAATLAELVSVPLQHLMSISTSIDQVISTEMAALEQKTADIPHLKCKSGISPSSPIIGVSTKFQHCRSSPHSSPKDVQDLLV